jgi:hypothetical protein
MVIMFFYVFFLAASERIPFGTRMQARVALFCEVRIGANCRPEKSNQREKVIDSPQLQHLIRLNSGTFLLGRVQEARRRSGRILRPIQRKSRKPIKN